MLSTLSGTINWPEVLGLFEKYVPVKSKMDVRTSPEGIVYYIPSETTALESIVQAYAAFQSGRQDKFITWCKVLKFSLPRDVKYPVYLNTLIGLD